MHTTRERNNFFFFASLGPWNFLIFGAAFGYVGSKLESFQHNLLEELNVRNKEAGFPEIKREELSAWNTLSTHYDNTENEVLEQGKKNRA